jgi:hypothetical protein
MSREGVKLLFKPPSRPATGMGTSLRHLANLSHRHHRPTGYRDHTDPKDWPGLEGRRSGSNGQNPDPPRQTAEIRIRIALLNRFNALGTAEIARFG